jgi:hypothetical protein
MASDSLDAQVDEQLFSNPWPALLGGLVMTGAAALWLRIFDFAALPLVLVGLLATGAAVAIQPKSSMVLGIAALSGLLARLGLDWDSARLLLAVLSLVAGCAAILLLLPRVVRRLVISLMILVHFGGIMSAVFSVPPNPWLANVAWTHFYRPYLELLYLNNAYHFYSPEPGPGALIWFYVKYEDGSGQWYKIPNREENPVDLEYQRRLSLAESLNQLGPVGAFDENILRRRVAAGELYGIHFHPRLSQALQYREPVPFSKRMLETYSQHVARHVVHPTDPQQKVTGIRVYRVVHALLTPKEILDGVKPDAEWLYGPYYQGEYDADGRLKDPHDPFLYWLIPIFKTPDASPSKLHPDREKDGGVINCLDRHIKPPWAPAGG